MEVSECQTAAKSFDMRRVLTQPKLKSTYLEALRWATASPSPRVVREDCELGEYKLKANSMVIVHSRTSQMDKETWEIAGNPESDPRQFWPKRFLDAGDKNEMNGVADAIRGESKSTKRTNIEPISGPKSSEMQQRLLAMRPFGGGSQLCPGRYFATNEILGGMTALMMRLEVEVLDQELEKNGVPQPDLTRQGGLFPDRPLMVRMRRFKARPDLSASEAI